MQHCYLGFRELALKKMFVRRYVVELMVASCIPTVAPDFEMVLEEARRRVAEQIDRMILEGTK